MRAALFVISVAAVASVAVADVFFITAPDVIHFSRDETVSVNILGSNAEISVDVYIEDYPARSRRISQKTAQVPPNTPQLVEVKVEPNDLVWPEVESDQPVNQYVYLVAEAAAAGFKKEALVRVSANSHYVFIQTDKTIYTPRQTVYGRVFTMDHNMRPASTPVTLDIMNPQGVVIDRQVGLESDDGIINTHFTFPAIAMSGNWSIVAYYGHESRQNVTAKFEVKEYVLPTFSVKINAPKFILPADDRIIGFIEAKHTYGEAVAGRADVKLEVVQGDARRHFLTASKTLDMNGVYSFSLEISALTDLGENYQFPNLEGALLHVEATVTEVYTGKSQTSITRSTVFASSPYKIKFPRTSRYFKPALPYVLRMDSVFANGKTAGDVVLQVSATAVTGAGNVQVSGYGGEEEVNEVTSDVGGRAQFTLDIPRDAQSLTINVRTVDPNLAVDQQGRAELTINSYSSPSNSYMLVRSTAQVVRIGDILEAEVFITNIGDVNFLNYMVIGRGKILYQRTQARQAGIVTTLHIPVTHDMSPSVRLLVYYVRGNDEVVADSVWVDVVDQCQNPVTLEPSKEVYKPGEDARVKVSGTPGSKVALLAVDQAVYILNDKNSLTQEIMFKRMEDFDLGCTPGGGQNSQGVFKDIGLTTINNAGLTIPQRAQEGCPPPENRRKRSVGSAPLSDVSQCCRRGMSPLHPAAAVNTVRACQVRAANLQDATPNCIKAYFHCCKKTVRREQADGEGDRGRADGNAEDLNFLFDLIQENEDDIPVRSKFPESWLFLTKEIGEQGFIQQRVTFPDSITSWSLQAVGVSSSTGMCVAPSSNVTVYKDYFLQLDMPYSAIHEEQIEIRATLYNYRDDPLVALVYLEGTEGICYGARAGENTESIRLTIQPNKARQVAWPIVPLATGDFPIRVKAFTNAGGDIVEKKLHVVPAGVQKVITKTIVLDPSGDLQLRNAGPPAPGVQDGEQFVRVPLVLPAETVPGSAHCSISVTGEIMGPVTQAVLDGNTFQNLIRAPTGCGEQTLIKLGPMVYVAKYLKATNQLSGDKEKQVYDLIRQGVQHEMSFRKPEGGFAVWTGNRYPPSTWLTAFASKIFHQAREFNALQNDPSDIICKAVQWMSQQQKPTGAYEDPYRVHHREMTGGVGGDITFTAYVLVGMLETNCRSGEVVASKNRAVAFLEGQVANIVRPYQAAIVTYALTLAGSAQRTVANTRLREMAVYDEAAKTRHWPANTGALGAQKPYWYQRRPSVIEIETAAYAILAQVYNNTDIAYANPIVNWLMAQRTGNGAFISTQDTVIGLQALSTYTTHTQHSNLELECEITSSVDGQFREAIVVNENNADVQQSVEVSQLIGGELFVDVTGEGVGQAQVELVYNVHSVAAERCRFDLTVNTEENVPQLEEDDSQGNDDSDDDHDDEFDPDDFDPDDFDPDNPFGSLEDLDWDNMEWEDEGIDGVMDQNPFVDARRARAGGRGRLARGQGRNNAAERARVGSSNLVIRINSCVRYLGDEDVGMTILEVGLFTGFAPVADELDNLQKNADLGIGRYELNDRSVVFYLDTVPKDEPVCISFTAKRNFVVGMTHAVAVTVYDYYEPDEKCTKFYHPEFGSPLLHRMCDGDQCVCAEAKCGTCHSFEPFDEQPWSYGQLHLKACIRGMDYVMKITIQEIQFDIAFEIVTARVEQVIKKGAENVQVQQTLTFWKKSGCACPFLEEELTYYVMGRDGIPVENEAGQRKYKYMLDEGSYIIEYMDRANYPRGTAEWLQARDQHKFQREISKRGCGS